MNFDQLSPEDKTRALSLYARKDATMAQIGHLQGILQKIAAELQPFIEAAGDKKEK